MPSSLRGVDLREMPVPLDDLRSMVIGTGRDDEVAGGHGDSRRSAQARQRERLPPHVISDWQNLKVGFETRDHGPLAVSAGTSPQLEQHHIAEHGIARAHRLFDGASRVLVALRSQHFDPRR